MIITYLRSSAATTYDLCELRGFIEYGLGIKQKENIFAQKGSLIHKAMELLAKCSISPCKNGLKKIPFKPKTSLG